MEVINKIKVHYINGEETKVGGTDTLIIQNVWNKEKCVTISVDGGAHKFTVLAWELMKAIENATGNEKY